MTTLITTSVVRGSHQGESHGGVYLVDFYNKRITQTVDWNTTNINWQGRGWDRGLRGITFDDDRIFIGASNELFVYSPEFRQIASYKNPYLMHCHEIARHGRYIYLTSTGFDSIIGFDLDNNQFCFGLHIVSKEGGYQAETFDPCSDQGPKPGNQLHINNVVCKRQSMYISGLKTGGILKINKDRTITKEIILPKGIHNARPHMGGVLFNDTASDLVRYVTPESEKKFRVPHYRPEQLTHSNLDNSRIARAGFGRGLCVISETLIATGSSPSTIAIHDLQQLKTAQIVTISYDIRNAIHGLELWPY